jgi:methylated-DNA-[protein]-cysteine S-methyltransferase
MKQILIHLQRAIIGLLFIFSGLIKANDPLGFGYKLQEYFEGKRTHFSFPLHFIGTDFQQKVWDELSKIPFGTTYSYLDLAKKVGDIKAVRAVAAANAKNPLWIVIPCHRVIGSDGSLTGYAGGLWRKKWLLEHEKPSNQKSLFSLF